MKKKSCDAEVNGWIMREVKKEEKRGKEEEKEIKEMVMAGYDRDDNFEYNLNTGLNLLKIYDHYSWNAIEAILLKCAQCMSENRDNGKKPSCQGYCALYDIMREERYQLSDKIVYQSK